jgi:hypothetical protein
MNEKNHYARRYHWLSHSVGSFVNEPHAAIASEARGPALNLVAAESDPTRLLIPRIVKDEKPEKLLGDLKKIKTLTLPAHHYLSTEDLHPDSIAKILLSTYERQPEDFETLLGLQGVGARTVRALSLISELIYGVPPSYRDPARYSFAHGGKDGIPYPVDRKTYDASIAVLGKAIAKAKLATSDKREAIIRLDRMRT